MKHLFLTVTIGFFLSIIYVWGENGKTPKTDLKEVVGKEFVSSQREKVKRRIKNPFKNISAYRPKVYQPKKLYGFKLYDDWEETGFTEFSLDDLCIVDLLFPENPEYINYTNLIGGAYGNGTYYFFSGNDEGQAVDFNIFDLTSGKKTELCNYYDQEVQIIKVYDLTFDYSTHTMYGLISRPNTQYTKQVLATIRLTDGYAEDVTVLNISYSALAATYEGEIYGVTTTGQLAKINKIDGSQQSILDTECLPDDYCQSMEFDHTDGSLYWGAYTMDGEGFLIKMDVKNKTATNLGTLGENVQLAGLYIPFVRNDLNSPAPASGLQLIVGEGGKAEADLLWKNPEVTLNNDALNHITKVEVYRNEKIMKTFTSVTVGEEMSFHDTEVPNGFNTYKVVVWNEVGEGAPTSVTDFVGHDVPDVVTALSVSKISDTAAKISWKAPVRGIAGGWIDKANITYNIIRYPDNTVVKTDYSGTEFIDNGLFDLKTYFYSIEPVTPDGKGAISESEHVIIGEAIRLPYRTNFFYTDESSLWTVINANEDRNVWVFDPIESLMLYGEEISAAIYFGRGADDWMISSPMRLKGGKGYEIAFDERVGTEDTITLEVTVGKGADIEAQNKSVRKFALTNNKFSRQKMRLPALEEGDYNIGIHITENNAEILRSIQLTNLEVKVSTASSIKGKIVYEGKPLEGVSVTFKKGDEVAASSVSDEEGEYEINYIESGSYTCIVNKIGYHAIQKEVIVDEWTEMNMDFTLFIINTSNLRGKIIDVRNNPVEGAEVRLTGYKTYLGMSGEDGSFEIPDVYNSNNYCFTVFKNKLKPYTCQINVEKDEDISIIQLEDKLLSPDGVYVTATEIQATVSWEEPLDKKIYRYDDGIVVDQRGWVVNNFIAVLGSVYRQPALLNTLSWFTVEDGYRDHDFVDVFVFDLDEKGNPSLNILYHEENVPNTPGKWMNYTFETPVSCPNGFVIALSSEGFLALGIDAGTNEEYPFREGTQCGSKDYRTEPFDYTETTNPPIRNNFMLRAGGIPLGATFERTNLPNKISRKLMQSCNKKGEGNRIISRPSLLPASVENRNKIMTEEIIENEYRPAYEIYRLKVGEEDQSEKWVRLTQDHISTLSYIDNKWNDLEVGFYKYAVRAVYTGDKLSEAVFSDAIGKDVLTTVTVNITTNVEKSSLEGAEITLQNGESEYRGKTDVSGKAILPKILKGKYSLSVILPGCETYIKEMDYSLSDEYNTNVQLTEAIIAPTALKIENTEIDMQRLFSWDEFSLFDDFESCLDFEVNPSGKTGWNYIDGDEENTIILSNGESDIIYSHMGEPMAYILFNPYVTRPTTDKDGLTAYSGRRFLACITTALNKNDDYIISPELNSTTDFYLSFYGRSYNSNELEQIRVGYSFTGKQAKDFIWMTEAAIEVPNEWTKFVYSVPAGTRYVTIHCVSEQKFIFMLDDIYIGTNPGASQICAVNTGDRSYEIYLDGNKVTTQNKTSYLFNNLQEGTHVAGVKAVYATGISEMSTVNFNVSLSTFREIEAENDIVIYPNPVENRLFITGKYEKLCIYDMSGRKVIEYNSPVHSVDVSKWRTGVYTVRIMTGEKVIVKKVIVKK